MSTTPKAPNFGYLAEKEPSDLHHALKAFIEDHGGPETDLKTVQAVLAAHGKFQASDYNKNRESYKPRTAQSIYKGGVTTSERFHYAVDPTTGAEVRVEGPKPEPKAVEPKAVEAPKPKAATKAPARRKAATPAASKTATTAAAKAPTRRPRKAVATATK